MQGRRLTVAMLLGAVALVLAQGASAQTTTVERRGHALLKENCARCHAIETTGASTHPQAPPFRTLGQRYPIESLEEALGEGLMSGHPDMPEFQFEPEDVGAIIAYLKSIQETPPK